MASPNLEPAADGKVPAAIAEDGVAVLLAAVDASVPGLLLDLRKALYELEPTYAEFLDARDEDMLAAARTALLGVIAPAVATGPAEPAAARGAGLTPEWLSNPATSAEGGIDDLLFGEIGRAQWRLGIPIGTLMAAYRLGARITWRHLSDALVGAGARPAVLAEAAEAVFCSVDAMSSASAAGFLTEQSHSSATRERSRDELVDLLMSGRRDPTAIAGAARRASWPLPETASIVLLADAERGAAPVVPEDWLTVRWAGRRGYVVPGSSEPAVRDRLRTLLAGCRAAIGWAGPPERLSDGLKTTELALQLQADGILRDDPVFLDEHLDAVLVHREPALLEALRSRALEPLDRAAPGSRQVLYDTLRAYFRHFGDRRAMAAELTVHPQTVRYRMDRLRDLFGADLDDPDARLKLLLAVSWDH